MQTKQKRLEEEFHKMWLDLGKRNYVKQEQLDEVVKKLGDEMKEVRESMCKDHSSAAKEEGIAKLQVEVSQLKSGMENRLTTTVQEVKEDIEESWEIERRKMNIIIHGVKDEDAEKDLTALTDLFEDGLKLVFDRHVDKVVRLGRVANEEKPRPIKVILKRVDCRKEILIRAKSLKESDRFKKVFITPDLTRKQQEVDKELRKQLRKFKDDGEVGAKIQHGKVVKNLSSGQVVVLYQPPLC